MDGEAQAAKESPADLCLSALLDLSESMLDASDSQPALHRIASRLAGIMGGQQASLALLEPLGAGGHLAASTHPAATVGMPIDLHAVPALAQVLTSGQTVVVTRLLRGVGLDTPEEPTPDQTATTMIPVLLDRRVQGILFTRHDGPEAIQPDPERLRLGRIIANTAGIALRNARLHESIRSSSVQHHSDRLKAEQRLRQIEKYQRFFDFAGDGLVIVDGRGAILFANRAAQSILGFEARAIAKIMLGDLVASDGRELLEGVLRGIREGHYHRDLEVPIIRSSGERVMLSITTAPLEEPITGSTQTHSDGDGPVLRPLARPADAVAILSFRDVTATRRLELELQQAQRKLELNDRQVAIVELAGAAAHELNQPLTSIIGMLELLARKVTPESSVARSVQQLLVEAERVADIVRKFGQISRYETKPYLGATDIVDLDRAARGERQVPSLRAVSVGSVDEDGLRAGNPDPGWDDV